MKLHELLGSYQKQTQGMTKLSAEEKQGIIKRAGEILSENLDVISFAEDIAKTASAEIDKIDFSEPEIQKVASELLSYGAGRADGEMMAKIAMAPAIYEEAYSVIMEKIAEVMGPEAAEAVDGSLRAAGGEEQAIADELEQVHGEIAENVAQAIVENAGGIEAVTKDPELSRDIAEQADQIATQIIEENLSGQGQGAPQGISQPSQQQ